MSRRDCRGCSAWVSSPSASAFCWHRGPPPLGTASLSRRRSRGGYLSAKGVRDIVSGLVVFLLIATAGHRVLGEWMLVMALIPIGDAIVVLRSGGSKATAYGVHMMTAVVMAVIGILLLA